MSFNSSHAIVIHLVTDTHWWDAQILISAATLLSVILAQVVILRIEGQRARREDDRRQEQDATRAVAAFLSSVAALNPDGGDEALNSVRTAALAMDVYLSDALVSSAEDVVLAVVALTHADELDDYEDDERTRRRARLRGRLELARAAHKFQNDFRVSRNLPVRKSYL